MTVSCVRRSWTAWQRHVSGGINEIPLLVQVLDEDGSITDPFIRNYLDLLCFLLSGLPSDGTIAAEVAFMFNVSAAPCLCLLPQFCEERYHQHASVLIQMFMTLLHVMALLSICSADLVQARGAAGVPGGRLAGDGQCAGQVLCSSLLPGRLPCMIAGLATCNLVCMNVWLDTASASHRACVSSLVFLQFQPPSQSVFHWFVTGASRSTAARCSCGRTWRRC